jgi:hypothetical protein
MRPEIKNLLKKCDELITKNNQLLFEIYEFILECEGLAPLD